MKKRPRAPSAQEAHGCAVPLSLFTRSAGNGARRRALPLALPDALRAPPPAGQLSADDCPSLCRGRDVTPSAQRADTIVYYHGGESVSRRGKKLAVEISIPARPILGPLPLGGYQPPGNLLPSREKVPSVCEADEGGFRNSKIPPAGRPVSGPYERTGCFRIRSRGGCPHPPALEGFSLCRARPPGRAVLNRRRETP